MLSSVTCFNFFNFFSISLISFSSETMGKCKTYILYIYIYTLTLCLKLSYVGKFKKYRKLAVYKIQNLKFDFFANA